jgi:hypothetical protein
MLLSSVKTVPVSIVKKAKKARRPRKRKTDKIKIAPSCKEFKKRDRK